MSKVYTKEGAIIAMVLEGKKFKAQDQSMKYCYYNVKCGIPFRVTKGNSNTNYSMVEQDWAGNKWVEYEEPAKELSVEQLEGILGYKIKVVGR